MQLYEWVHEILLLNVFAFFENCSIDTNDVTVWDSRRSLENNAISPTNASENVTYDSSEFLKRVFEHMHYYVNAHTVISNAFLNNLSHHSCIIYYTSHTDTFIRFRVFGPERHGYRVNLIEISAAGRRKNMERLDLWWISLNSPYKFKCHCGPESRRGISEVTSNWETGAGYAGLFYGVKSFKALVGSLCT